MGHRSRGVQGQSDPPGNRKFLSFRSGLVSRATVVSGGAKAKTASLELNQGKFSFKSLHVMLGQGYGGCHRPLSEVKVMVVSFCRKKPFDSDRLIHYMAVDYFLHQSMIWE